MRYLPAGPKTTYFIFCYCCQKIHLFHGFSAFKNMALDMQDKAKYFNTDMG